MGRKEVNVIPRHTSIRVMLGRPSCWNPERESGRSVAWTRGVRVSRRVEGEPAPLKLRGLDMGGG